MSTYTWTIEITATADMVADGFDIGAFARADFHNGECLSRMGRAADHWSPDAVRVAVVAEPDRERIAREQGFRTTSGHWAKRIRNNRNPRHLFIAGGNAKGAAS